VVGRCGCTPRLRTPLPLHTMTSICVRHNGIMAELLDLTQFQQHTQLISSASASSSVSARSAQRILRPHDVTQANLRHNAALHIPSTSVPVPLARIFAMFKRAAALRSGNQAWMGCCARFGSSPHKSERAGRLGLGDPTSALCCTALCTPLMAGWSCGRQEGWDI
jgi:hypothetical protein